jgi:hypothetical protein
MGSFSRLASDGAAAAGPWANASIRRDKACPDHRTSKQNVLPRNCHGPPPHNLLRVHRIGPPWLVPALSSNRCQRRSSIARRAQRLPRTGDAAEIGLKRHAKRPPGAAGGKTGADLGRGARTPGFLRAAFRTKGSRPGASPLRFFVISAKISNLQNSWVADSTTLAVCIAEIRRKQ